MKKHNLYDQVNKQEDEDASAYPLYPAADDIYNRSKNKGELSHDSNTKIAEKIDLPDDWHDHEFETDAAQSKLDVPGSDLDDKDEKIGEEDEENNYYSLGGDDHNDLDEDDQS